MKVDETRLDVSWSSKAEPSPARWELGDACGPAQAVTSCAHHWGRDVPSDGHGTAPQAQRVLLLGFPSSLAGVCLQPSRGLAMMYQHAASAAGKPRQHPSLSHCDQRQHCIFSPAMPMDPGQTQAMSCSLHTAGAPASPRCFPGWQRSQHPSPMHGRPQHELRVLLWGSIFPHPPALPSPGVSLPPTHVHPSVPQSTHVVCTRPLHRSSRVIPLSPEQSLSLTPGLNITWAAPR